MRAWVGQTSFAAGMLDPALESRTDLEVYFAGALNLENVINLPQGGVRRRPGLEYLATLQSQTTRILPFIFNTEQRYIVAMSSARLDVYDAEDGSVITSNIAAPWTISQPLDVDYAQTGDVMIIVHPDHAPRRLVRASDGTFSLAVQTLDFVPQFDFNDTDSPTAVSEVQEIVFDTEVLGGDEYRLELNGLETDTIRFSEIDAENHDRIEKALLDLPNTGTDGITVTTISTGVSYEITFAGASANNWELMAGRLVYTQSSAADVITITRDTAGTARTENVWSADRGWPRTVSFHESRLWFGGSKSRPDTLWGSRVGQFFNFDTYRSRDDDAIQVTLATAQVNVIQGITSGRALQVFTTGGEFAVPQPSGAPITPETVSFRKQTGFGSARLKPIVIDGATLFMDRSLTALREFVFAETEDAYSAPPLNLRVPSLFNSPIEMAASTSADVNAANYVYVVMKDGTMAVLNTLRSEQITAWSKWITDGAFLSATVVDEEVFFCVSRTINGNKRRFLERANLSHRLDGSVFDTGVAGLTITGVGHLDDQEVTIREGLALIGTGTPASGTITLDVSTVNAEVGFNFDVRIETMPLVSLFQGGSTVTRNKRLVRSHVDVFESTGFTVAGENVLFSELDTTFGGESVYSGRQEVWHDGWFEDRLTVEIVQEGPFPFYLRGIEIEVKA